MEKLSSSVFERKEQTDAMREREEPCVRRREGLRDSERDEPGGERRAENADMPKM